MPFGICKTLMKCVNVLESDYCTPGHHWKCHWKSFPFVRAALEIGSSDRGASRDGRCSQRVCNVSVPEKRAVNWVAGINGKMNYEQVCRQAQLLRGSRLNFTIRASLAVPWGEEVRYSCGSHAGADLVRVHGQPRQKQFDTISIWLTWYYEAILSFQCVRWRRRRTRPKLFSRTFSFFRGVGQHAADTVGCQCIGGRASVFVCVCAWIVGAA